MKQEKLEQLIKDSGNIKAQETFATPEQIEEIKTCQRQAREQQRFIDNLKEGELVVVRSALRSYDLIDKDPEGSICIFTLERPKPFNSAEIFFGTTVKYAGKREDLYPEETLIEYKGTIYSIMPLYLHQD